MSESVRNSNALKWNPQKTYLNPAQEWRNSPNGSPKIQNRLNKGEAKSKSPEMK